MAKKRLTEENMIKQTWKLRKKLAELGGEDERIEFESEHDFIGFAEEAQRYTGIGFKREKICQKIVELTQRAKDKNYQKVLLCFGLLNVDSR